MNVVKSQIRVLRRYLEQQSSHPPLRGKRVITRQEALRALNRVAAELEFRSSDEMQMKEIEQAEKEVEERARIAELMRELSLRTCAGDEHGVY